MPSLKFLMALPMPRPSCGSLFAPKIRITITRMTTSSGKPNRGNMAPLLQVPAVSRVVNGRTATIVPLFLGATLAVSAATGVTEGRAASQFASGIDLVDVYATVTDADGQLVTGLEARDFQVSEDGRPQTITTFAAGS